MFLILFFSFIYMKHLTPLLPLKKKRCPRRPFGAGQQTADCRHQRRRRRLHGVQYPGTPLGHQSHMETQRKYTKHHFHFYNQLAKENLTRPLRQRNKENENQTKTKSGSRCKDDGNNTETEEGGNCDDMR